MTIVRIGASKKYSDNWEAAFGRRGAAKTAAAANTRGKKMTAKKTSKKSAKSRKK